MIRSRLSSIVKHTSFSKLLQQLETLAPVQRLRDSARPVNKLKTKPGAQRRPKVRPAAFLKVGTSTLKNLEPSCHSNRLLKLQINVMFNGTLEKHMI